MHISRPGPRPDSAASLRPDTSFPFTVPHVAQAAPERPENLSAEWRGITSGWVAGRGSDA